MLKMPSNYDAQLVTTQRMKPDGSIGVYVGDQELTPAELQSVEQWRQDGIAAKAAQQQQAPSNYTPPLPASAPSMFSTGPAQPPVAQPSAGGLAAVNQQLRPIGAQQVSNRQAALNPQAAQPAPAAGLSAVPSGGSAMSGSGPTGTPTPASMFSYWQQYAPSQPAMPTAQQAQPQRQRRGWFTGQQAMKV